MIKRLLVIVMLIGAFAFSAFAQNTPEASMQTTRRRTATTTTTATTPQPANDAAAAQERSTAPQGDTGTATRTPRRAAAGRAAASHSQEPNVSGVLEAFGELVEGIQRADVKAVTNAYWNSPQLVLFNNNGTVTRGWEQLRRNRASSYPEMKDVRLDIRDRHVQMLGAGAALVTCLWTQSQTFRGVPETASGRMTLVYRRLGSAWKIVHLHTSPDAPDPSRVLPSEQTPVNKVAPTPQPAVKSRPTPPGASSS
ncbi:MAG: nuclear transport factor 2 family protein [Pyrinomonadaceae bacterium]